MTPKVQQMIEGATSFALATHGVHGLNVVPISVWQVQGDDIFLYDFFMRKSAENIKSDSTVSITCWREFIGVQVKGVASYETSGEDYEAAVVDMKERFPDRTLAGLIRITPTEIFDVAPGGSPEDLLTK